MCHFTLNSLFWYVIPLAVFYKYRSRFYKTKFNIFPFALNPQGLHPVVTTWSCTVIVFSSAHNLFNFACFKILFHMHFPYKRGTHDPLVFKRKLHKQRQSFVSSSLIFTRYIKEHILPAVAPVRRQVFFNSLRSFCQKIKYNITSCLYYIPYFLSPLISLFYKEVRCHTYPYNFSAFDFILTFAVFFQWIIKTIFRFIYITACFSSLPVQKIHITVFTAFAYFITSVPWIPYVVHVIHFPLYFS